MSLERVALKTALLDEINRIWKRSKRWIPKGELETFSKSIGYLGDNGTRRLRKMASKKHGNPLIDRKEIDGKVHYRKLIKQV